jgi:hypothetical protein
MYNLRALAGILVESPLGDDATRLAGPTFEMPYTTTLPDGEADRFRLYRDLIAATATQVQRLLDRQDISATQRAYLQALAGADARSLETIAAILDGPGTRRS